MKSCKSGPDHVLPPPALLPTSSSSYRPRTSRTSFSAVRLNSKVCDRPFEVSAVLFVQVSWIFTYHKPSDRFRHLSINSLVKRPAMQSNNVTIEDTSTVTVPEVNDSLEVETPESKLLKARSSRACTACRRGKNRWVAYPCAQEHSVNGMATDVWAVTLRRAYAARPPPRPASLRNPPGRPRPV